MARRYTLTETLWSMARRSDHYVWGGYPVTRDRAELAVRDAVREHERVWPEKKVTTQAQRAAVAMLLTRKNPDEDAIALAEMQAAEHDVIGSRLPRAQREVLQAISKAFGGGYAFSREELAAEVAGQIHKASGARSSAASSSIEASKAVKVMLAAGILRAVGSRLDAHGRQGPERYVLTGQGEELALGDRVAAADDYAATGLDAELARLEREEEAFRPRLPRTRTVVDPHAARRPPCRLCKIGHSLKAHSRHAVDSTRRKVTLAGAPFDEDAFLALNPGPRSKKCAAGAHDFDPRTLACTRKGCTARRDEPGTAYLFGFSPDVEADVLRREEASGQREMFRGDERSAGASSLFANPDASIRSLERAVRASPFDDTAWRRLVAASSRDGLAVRLSHPRGNATLLWPFEDDSGLWRGSSDEDARVTVFPGRLLESGGKLALVPAKPQSNTRRRRTA